MDDEDRRAELVNIAEQVRHAVWAGYDSPEEIVYGVTQSNVGTLEDVEEEELVHIVRDLMEPELRRHLEAQCDWPAVTDCDRLDAALDDAEGRGIVCGRNVGWTRDEAGDETVRLALAARAAGREVRGYAYFKGQDTEHAVDGEALWLAFGRIEGEADLVPDAGVGRELCDVLAAHELPVDWNERAEERIAVRMAWRRRRPEPRKPPFWRRLLGRR